MLPTLASFYRLNNQYFSSTAISDKLNTITAPTAAQLATLVGTNADAVTIGLFGEPIFNADIPWSIDTSVTPPVPTYQGKAIKLECDLCKTNCVACPANMPFYILSVNSKKSCYMNCPVGFFKELVVSGSENVATGKCL